MYEGKEILEKEAFYCWINNNKDFHEMFEKYKESGFDMKLAPSIDRKSPSGGYVEDNMEIVTHSENSSRSGRKVVNVDGVEYNSISDAAKALSIPFPTLSHYFRHGLSKKCKHTIKELYYV